MISNLINRACNFTSINRIKQTVSLLSVGLAAIAAIGLVSGQAAQADTLTLGDSYHPFYVTTSFPTLTESHALEAGGDAQGVLNGVSLAGTYCVDILDPVYLSSTYPTTQVTTNGTVFGQAVNNAGEISWMLTEYGSTQISIDQQDALQAAIWKTEYGSNFQLDGADNSNTGNPADLISDYQTILTNLGTNTAPVSNVVWMSPDDNTARNYNYQGLVGVGYAPLGTVEGNASAIPEQGTLALLIPAAIVLGGRGLQRRRRAH